MDQQPNPSIQQEQPSPQPQKPLSKTWQIAALVVGILVVAGIAYGSYYLWQKSTGNTSQKACTMEAKQCADGSYVGRTGPNCEFAVCPSVSASVSPSPSVVADETVDWQTYKNEKYGFEVKYPRDWYIKSSNGDIITRIENKQKDVYLGSDVPSGGLDKYDFGYSIYVQAESYLTSEKFLEAKKTSFGDTVVNLELVRLGANEFYKRIADLPGSVGMETYYIYNGDIGYEITMYNSISNKDLAIEVALSVFHQILSTFKFTK